MKIENLCELKANTFEDLGKEPEEPDFGAVGYS
jgi:hypothetical protein